MGEKPVTEIEDLFFDKEIVENERKRINEKLMDAYIKNIQAAIENLDVSARMLENSLEIMKLRAELQLDVNQQKKVAASFKVVIDHFKKIINEVEYTSLYPIENSSHEYTR
jgi:hypothetical protein